MQDKTDHQLNQWKEQKPGLDLDVMGLCARILRTNNYLTKEIWEHHKSMGLSKGDFDVLATLRRSGEPYTLTPTELYKATLLTSGAMTNRLDRLEEANFIERVHSNEDRRSFLVKLSDQGFAKIEEAVEEHVENEHKLVAALSQEEQAQLSGLLRKWLMDFEANT